MVALCVAAQLVPAALPPVLAQSRLPALGDAAAEDFGVATERQLGDRIMREIRRDPDYLDDPVLLEYLESIWQPLLVAARTRGDVEPEIDQRFAWEAFLVRDRSVNAFALPGGFVGVHLGLIAMTATRDELASVMAHEMSHVTQRHIARGMSISKRQTLVNVAAMILGVLAASRTRSTDTANAVITGGQALAVQGQLNFSRDMEREADRIGFAVLTRAGFAPGGMAAMFEKLDHNSRLNDGGGFPYLRSHPLSTERIGEARSRMGTVPSAAPVSVLAHVAAQARARVLMDTRAVALHRWQTPANDKAGQEKPRGTADQLAVAYSDALASTLLHEWPRADQALQLALGIVRGNPRSDAAAERAVVLLAVQSRLERGDVAGAMSLLAPYASTAGNARPVMLLTAQAVLATPKDVEALKRSASDLQTWTSMHPVDAAAWSALARTWQLLGQPLRALRAEAESSHALGDLTGAVDRLRAGQRLARAGGQVDFIEASVIDTRLREFEAQKRQAELAPS
ncbi:MAG: hypothetical protein RLZZ618_3480 [Pseudomonadota bacterium]